MKKQIILTILGLLLLSGLSHAQGIGVVSRTAIYQSMPSFIKDLQMIDSLQSTFSAEVQKENLRLQDRVRTLLTAYNPKDDESIEAIKKRMSPKDTVALKAAFDDDVALGKKKNSYDTRLARLQQEKVDPVLKKIDEAIKKVAEGEKLDVVYFIEDVNNTMAYFSEKRNYTSQVIAALKAK